MGISKGSAHWDGSARDGHGTMKPEHAAEAKFSVKSRFEGEQGSSPEELIAAALSGCFSMALAFGLAQGGLAPKSITTSAKVHLDKDGAGFAIKTIELTTEASVPGLDDAKFQEIALETKKNCPVSKVLAGATISLQAKLVTA